MVTSMNFERFPFTHLFLPSPVRSHLLPPLTSSLAAPTLHPVPSRPALPRGRVPSTVRAVDRPRADAPRGPDPRRVRRRLRRSWDRGRDRGREETGAVGEVSAPGDQVSLLVCRYQTTRHRMSRLISHHGVGGATVAGEWGWLDRNFPSDGTPLEVSSFLT